jgi:superfamily I DNA and RNA helicase
MVVDADIPEKAIFNTLIIDEGQDFEPEWYEVLKLFLPDDAAIVWLEDPRQNLYQKPPVELEGFVTYEAKTNYRTPQSIARFIDEVMDIDCRWPNDLPGMGVGVHGYEEEEEQVKIVSKIVHQLMRAGFGHGDIVIVGMKGYAKSVFYTTEDVAGLSIRKFTGEYDAGGNQVFSDGQLVYDSIYRYKGQESPAVILVDVDPYGGTNDRSDAALFCGMTRATVRLEILAKRGNEGNCRLFGLDTS